MNLKFEIKENSCVIVPQVLKSRIEQLVSIRKLANVKVCTFKDIEHYLSFSYTNDALYFLTTTCHLSIPVAKMILDELRYIEDKSYSEERLEKLVIYYRILKEYQKLNYSSYGISFLKRFPVTVFGFDFFTKKEEFYLEQLRGITTVEIPSIEEEMKNRLLVHAYSHIKEEVEGLAYQLALLLEKEIDPSHIYVAGFSDDYLPYGERIFPYYQLPLDVNVSITLYETSIGLFFLSLVKTNTREEVVQKLKEKYGKTKEELRLVNACIDILNQYAWYEGTINNLYDYILADVQEKEVSHKQVHNQIQMTTLLHNHFTDEDYVFVVGANQGSFPTISKDENYITDDMALFTLKEDSVTENKQKKEGLKQALSRIPNLYISYKEKTDDMIYYPSSLLSEMNFEIVPGELTFDQNYSGEYQKIHMASYLDDLKNYNSYHKSLSSFRNTYGIQEYLSYDHTFKPWEKIHYQPRLSYTSMSTYFECAFKYYLTYLLSLAEFEETFAQKVGNIYHQILSMWECSRDEIEQELQKQEESVSFDAKESVWWESLRIHLFDFLDILKEQKDCTDFKKEYHEKEIITSIPSRPEITLKGIVDKIMTYEESGREYAALVDYKTGSPDISMKYLKYGFGMQLPFYLYLLNHSNEFKGDTFAGFYLQKCLNYKLVTKHHENIDVLKKDSLRLEGYSTNDEEILRHLDKTYDNSMWIKGLKKTKSGFSSYAKLVSKNQTEDILNQMEANIIFAYDQITQGNFKINPKVIEKENKSCSFCPFQDICFKTNNDIVYLGGDEDE